MSRPIASHPPWTPSGIGAGIAVAGTQAAVQREPDPVARAHALSTVARVLQDVMLVVIAVFLFPVVILLIGSPVALLVKAVLAGVQRFL